MNKTNFFAMRFGMIIASFLCTVFVLELVSRAFLPKPQGIMIEHLKQNPDGAGPLTDKIGLTAPDIFYRTPTGLRLRPNVQGVIDGHDLSKKRVAFSTNSLGYRHRELPIKTDTDIRILALGDSILFQEYLPSEETITYTIEQHIKKNLALAHQGKHIEVINAGVGMIGSENELAILMETGLSVRPDIVLVEMYLNDARESFSLKLVKTPPLLRQSYLANSLVHAINILRKQSLANQITDEQAYQDGLQFLSQYPVNPVSSGWQSSPPSFNRLIVEYFHDWGYAWSDTYWRKMETVFRLMKELSEEYNFSLAVVLFPVRYQVQSDHYSHWPQQQFSLLMNKLDIDHVDLLPILRKQYERDSVNVYYDHAHPTASGSAIIGEAIGDFLKKTYAL